MKNKAFFHNEVSDIYIRPMTYDDIDDVVRWRNSDEVRKYFIYQGDFTRDSQIDWMKNHVETGEVAQMIICKTKDDRPLGCVYIRDIDMHHKKGEYGIFLADDVPRGKGIGTKAAKLMVKYGFEELGLHRIYLRAIEGNDRALKSYENAGFVKEGFLKDDVCINGKYVSIVWMAVVKSEQ